MIVFRTRLGKLYRWNVTYYIVRTRLVTLYSWNVSYCIVGTLVTVSLEHDSFNDIVGRYLLYR